MKLNIRNLFRFEAYRHIVPCSACVEMEFDSDSAGDEIGILWLRPRANYPFYLREYAGMFGKSQHCVLRRHLESTGDDNGIGHIVAIEISRTYSVSCRRYWAVRSYDVFHGWKRSSSGSWYGDPPGGKPAEAVDVRSIRPGTSTISFPLTSAQQWDLSGLKDWRAMGYLKARKFYV
jgi:hypothetical protein